MKSVDPVKAVVATRLSHCPHDYTEGMILQAFASRDELEELARTTAFQRHRDDLHTYPESLLCVLLDLKDVVRWLPLRQRKAVMLLLVEGRSESEAAETLHINRHFLGERIRGALINLRHLLNSAHHPLRERGRVVALPSIPVTPAAMEQILRSDEPRGGDR